MLRKMIFAKRTANKASNFDCIFFLTKNINCGIMKALNRELPCRTADRGKRGK